MQPTDKYREILNERLSELSDREAALKRGKILIEAKLANIDKAWSKEQKGATELFKKVMGHEIIRKKKVFQKKDKDVVPLATTVPPAVAAGVPEKAEKNSSFFPWAKT